MRKREQVAIDRQEALDAAEAALPDNWRNWGTRTVAREVLKAIEAAGFSIVRTAVIDGRDDGA